MLSTSRLAARRRVRQSTSASTAAQSPASAASNHLRPYSVPSSRLPGYCKGVSGRL
jgi:hypothetical protein